VAWLAPPELPVGVEPELKPPELELELPVLEPEFAELEPELVPVELEPELLELEPVEPELLPELEPELELAEVELDPLDVLALLAEPGSARASAPAVTTLATVTAVVVDRTLDRPRSLAATAWRIPSSRRSSLMSSIVRSRFPGSLHESSGPAMSPAGSSRLPPTEPTHAPRTTPEPEHRAPRGPADSMRVAFYRIDAVERHIH
jgi:hypothetical protein